MKRGFSLVELSIVLVILGLLVGGVLSGRALIKTSEVRNMISQLDKVRAAKNTFQGKYFALAGDMPNATQFWGAQAGSATSTGTDATCAALSNGATSTATCNGDGNGKLDLQYEGFRFWQHLANAALIEGTYGGVYSDPSYIGTYPGKNVFALRRSNTGITAYYLGSINAYYFDGTYDNIFILGATTYGGNGWMDNPAVSVDEAWNIDTKIDDGKPGTGKVKTTSNAYNPTCASVNPNNSDPWGWNGNNAVVTYQVTNTALDTSTRTGGCALLVNMN